MVGVERVARERQVADLAGGAVEAAEELVVDDDAHADAGADRDHDEGRDAAREPAPLLADGGHVDVVVDQHGHVEAVLERGQRVELAGRAHVPGRARSRARVSGSTTPGRGDAHRQQVAVAAGRARGRSARIAPVICSSTARGPSREVSSSSSRSARAVDVDRGDAQARASRCRRRRRSPAAELTVNASGVRPRRPGRSPAVCTSSACTSRSTTADTVGLEMFVRSAISGRVIGPSRKIVSRIACSLSSRSRFGSRALPR